MFLISTPHKTRTFTVRLAVTTNFSTPYEFLGLLTLLQCAAKVISAFLIFAVLVLRVNDCRPYTSFKTVKFFCFFPLIILNIITNSIIRLFHIHWSTGFRHLRTSALEPPSSVSAVAEAITVHVPAKPKDTSDGRKITAVASQRRCDIA